VLTRRCAAPMIGTESGRDHPSHQPVAERRPATARMKASRDGLPSLYVLAAHWSESPELPDDHWARCEGIGRPTCFRCWWTAPVPDAETIREDNPDWTDKRALARTWQLAGRFLDRAHLADCWKSGDNTAANVIPLCHFPCHRDMPMFIDRDKALAWVLTGKLAPAWWEIATASTAETWLTDRRHLAYLYRKALERRVASLESLLEVPASMGFDWRTEEPSVSAARRSVGPKVKSGGA
jgi:hypothetical protein